METQICPKGHSSSELDYCSECGTRLDGAGVAEPGSPATAAEEHCPECGAAREQLGIVFCEICGYNFETGSRGGEPAAGPGAPVTAPAGPMPPAPTLAKPAQSQAAHWQVMVTVDAALREAQSPEAPQGVAPMTVALSTPVSLIGRRSQARAIFPEIDLSYDGAVSHRHALLQVDAAGAATLRDIGASNGTRLNGRTIEPLKDHKLAAGDEITLGHWTRLVVQAVD